MLHSNVDICWMDFFGRDYLDGDFGGGFFMTGCFARNSIEPGGRWLDICQTEDGRRFDGREGGRMLHSKVDGCWVEDLGRDHWGGDFGDVFIMTGCFARTWIEPGGRRLDICSTEDGRRFDGREGGRMLHSKVDGYWVEDLGRDHWGGILGRVFL
jgi:hypothetical protein